MPKTFLPVLVMVLLCTQSSFADEPRPKEKHYGLLQLGPGVSFYNGILQDRFQSLGSPRGSNGMPMLGPLAWYFVLGEKVSLGVEMEAAQTMDFASTSIAAIVGSLGLSGHYFLGEVLDGPFLQVDLGFGGIEFYPGGFASGSALASYNGLHTKWGLGYAAYFGKGGILGWNILASYSPKFLSAGAMIHTLALTLGGHVAF